MTTLNRALLVATGACLATLALATVAAVDTAEAPEQPSPHNLTQEVTLPEVHLEPAPSITPDDREPIIDTDPCVIDGEDVCMEPAPTPEPEPTPEPDGYHEFVEDWRDAIYNDWRVEGYPGRALAEWQEGTLECGINAKPAIDQDLYGNWWAYCEPALID